MRVIYRPMPPEAEAVLRPLVDAHRRIVPGWCGSLVFEYVREDSDPPAYMDTMAQPEYRTATVALYPRFWALSDDEREETLVHEFYEVVLSPVREAWQALRDIVADDLALAKWVDEDFRKDAEGVVSDLAAGWLR